MCQLFAICRHKSNCRRDVSDAERTRLRREHDRRAWWYDRVAARPGGREALSAIPQSAAIAPVWRARRATETITDRTEHARRRRRALGVTRSAIIGDWPSDRFDPAVFVAPKSHSLIQQYRHFEPSPGANRVAPPALPGRSQP